MLDLNFSKLEIKSVARELGLGEDAFNNKKDEERYNIITTWDKRDIVACPGSGKTTVLKYPIT